MGVGRAEIRPTRVQGTKTCWVGWGPKRETRGAIGDLSVKIGGSTSQEMPGRGGWESSRCGVVPVWGSGSPHPSTQNSGFPDLDSLDVTENGSYCKE